MKIQILETRHYIGLGLKLAGDIVECSEELAEQLITQGLAKKIEKITKIKETIEEVK